MFQSIWRNESSIMVKNWEFIKKSFDGKIRIFYLRSLLALRNINAKIVAKISKSKYEKDGSSEEKISLGVVSAPASIVLKNSISIRTF